ncbi:bacteriohemerythrin [Anaeromyxobacter oryzae]|uniref:Hemerythrin-like domain-containing protein n=1 Tax=Anaeromyxobacter oryzae TaxID=2918170 RepID=A0ABN6MZW7_9BACT|nr:hemerythrin domain-containing protein [Anaeromyxobacter oryzae]BDG05283.1 hypothetical protein AMOR_42790 [Anaeromyxobacter oryzae]
MPIIDESQIPKVVLPTINADHAEEARLLNAAAAIVDRHLAGEADAAAVIDALDALYAHTRAHFEREDAATQAAAYPEHAAHRVEHERVLEALDSQERRFRETGDAEALRTFLADVHPAWFDDHVRTWDAAAARFGLEWGA